jgi:hypothetical protein
LHGGASQGQLRGVEEEDDDDFEEIGVDISGFGGPYAMRDLSTKKSVKRAKMSHDLQEAGLAAEYERLEARSREGGTLGGGMETVVEAPFLGGTRGPDPNASRLLAANNEDVRDELVRNEAQRAAEDTGEILVLMGGFPFRNCYLLLLVKLVQSIRRTLNWTIAKLTARSSDYRYRSFGRRWLHFK